MVEAAAFNVVKRKEGKGAEEVGVGSEGRE